MTDKILRQIKTFSEAKRAYAFLIAVVAAVAVISGINVGTVGPAHTEAAYVEEDGDVDMVFAARNLPVTTEALEAKKKLAIQEITADESGQEDVAEKEQPKIKKADSSTLAAKSGNFVYIKEIPMSHELQQYTYEKCVERGLEYELVLAVMWRESRFRPDVVHVNTNGTTDSGIMQINDVNKKWLYEQYGIDNLMDPYQNIDAGTAMLGTLTRKYGAHGAMLAYQYGEAGMTRKLRQGQTTSHMAELAYSQRDYYRQLV